MERGFQAGCLGPDFGPGCDKGIGGTENGAQTLVTVELGPRPAVGPRLCLRHWRNMGPVGLWVAGSGGGKRCVRQGAAV